MKAIGLAVTLVIATAFGASAVAEPTVVWETDGLKTPESARADLGGFFLGSALLCALGLRPGHSQLLTAAAVLLGAVAVGRTIGLVADDFDLALAGAVGIEIVMVALLAVAARHGVPASAAG